jgi:hypothetical protein
MEILVVVCKDKRADNSIQEYTVAGNDAFLFCICLYYRIERRRLNQPQLLRA